MVRLVFLLFNLCVLQVWPPIMKMSAESCFLFCVTVALMNLFSGHFDLAKLSTGKHGLLFEDMEFGAHPRPFPN